MPRVLARGTDSGSAAPKEANAKLVPSCASAARAKGWQRYVVLPNPTVTRIKFLFGGASRGYPPLGHACSGGHGAG